MERLSNLKSHFEPASSPGELMKAIPTSAVTAVFAIALAVFIFSAPAAAAQKVCDTSLVSTLNNLINAAKKVIPMVAFLFGITAVGAQSYYNSKDKKKKWKKRRNDAFLYGVFGVALAGQILNSLFSFAGISGSGCKGIPTLLPLLL